MPLVSVAQEKTVKQCEEEWRANKAENQAKGIKQKDYVAQCRGGTPAAATAPTAPGAQPPAPATPGGKGRTAKECRAEWQANKAENAAKGITEKQYVAQCRAGETAAAPVEGAAAPSTAEGGAAAPAKPRGKGKTAKECRAEWQANKAENEAKGVTERQYVVQCREGSAAAQPSAAPSPAAGPSEAPATTETGAAPSPTEGAAAPPAATPAKPRGKGKTAKECRAEWQANKADNEAKGVTEKQYVAQCRAGGAAAPSAAATPSAAPATNEPGAAAPAERAGAPPPAASNIVPGEAQYTSEAEAKTQCPSDTVVWVNLNSKVYHFAGSKNYGKTEKGAYMCEKEALAQGDRASKSEKHPR